MKYHVIVTGSRPTKKGNHFEAMPEENIKFIESVLKKLDVNSYVALYHGMAKGVDTVVDDYAFRNNIRVRQFPAYWFDPTKERNYDPRAGYFRNEHMVRAAKDAVYNKQDEQALLLAFHNTPTIQESRGTNHCFEFAKKTGLQTYAYQLPVLKTVTANEQLTPGEAAPF